MKIQRTRTAMAAVILSALSMGPGLAQEVDSDTTKPVAVGDSAPDFELQGLSEKPVRLADRFGEKGRPVILLFSRANW